VTPSVNQTVTVTVTVTTGNGSTNGTGDNGSGIDGSLWYWWVIATVGCFIIGLAVGAALGIVGFTYYKKRSYQSIE